MQLRLMALKAQTNLGQRHQVIIEMLKMHVSFGLLYIMFTFPTRIFYRGVPGFETDCPFGVWCRGLTTCPLYVGPFFGNLV